MEYIGREKCLGGGGWWEGETEKFSCSFRDCYTLWLFGGKMQNREGNKVLLLKQIRNANCQHWGGSTPPIRNKIQSEVGFSFY